VSVGCVIFVDDILQIGRRKTSCPESLDTCIMLLEYLRTVYAVCMYVCVCVCMYYVYVCVCLHVCVYVYMYMCVFIYGIVDLVLGDGVMYVFSPFRSYLLTPYSRRSEYPYSRCHK
jgi:hypothetical protein